MRVRKSATVWLPLSCCSARYSPVEENDGLFHGRPRG
jgi:hypothetical protein